MSLDSVNGAMAVYQPKVNVAPQSTAITTRNIGTIVDPSKTGSLQSREVKSEVKLTDKNRLALQTLFETKRQEVEELLGRPDANSSLMIVAKEKISNALGALAPSAKQIALNQGYEKGAKVGGDLTKRYANIYMTNGAAARHLAGFANYFGIPMNVEKGFWQNLLECAAGSDIVPSAGDLVRKWGPQAVPFAVSGAGFVAGYSAYGAGMLMFWAYNRCLANPTNENQKRLEDLKNGQLKIEDIVKKNPDAVPGKEYIDMFGKTMNFAEANLLSSKIREMDLVLQILELDQKGEIDQVEDLFRNYVVFQDGDFNDPESVPQNGMNRQRIYQDGKPIDRDRYDGIVQLIMLLKGENGWTPSEKLIDVINTLAAHPTRPKPAALKIQNENFPEHLFVNDGFDKLLVTETRNHRGMPVREYTVVEGDLLSDWTIKVGENDYIMRDTGLKVDKQRVLSAYQHQKGIARDAFLASDKNAQRRALHDEIEARRGSPLNFEEQKEAFGKQTEKKKPSAPLALTDGKENVSYWNQFYEMLFGSKKVETEEKVLLNAGRVFTMAERKTLDKNKEILDQRELKREAAFQKRKNSGLDKQVAEFLGSESPPICENTTMIRV